MANTVVEAWVSEMASLCKPKSILWCDGSEAEKERFTQETLQTGELESLNPQKLPNCFLHRSDPNDVARTEDLTFICTPRREEAGPTNNWMEPGEAYKKLSVIYDGAMRGRRMYVVPFLMGPKGSPASKVGIELTDSLYVALNMRIMTRMGKSAMEHLGDSPYFTRGLHSKADLNIKRRFICHFPQDNTIWSVGSGYGGNALLGKKCLALRIGSYLGEKEGWLAEHMLIVGIEDPRGKTTYIAAAFPSACGKTNLAMLVPPKSFSGYKVWTVGDDIAWMRPGKDGRLWAVNPEAGFFGVLPGTNKKSNPMAMETFSKNSIFTNVLKKSDGTLWWEGLEDPPAEGIDWRGNRWTTASGEKGAHPNSRFTAPASQCPCISPKWEKPEGVPISAILFGGRRSKGMPLVAESFNWQHGVFLGASMASETTAAAMGKSGLLRRDPMAMLPFCGYNMGDYFTHWFETGKRLKSPPKIFSVNWFRTDGNGKFLWPGFGENLRAILWILERCEGKGASRENPIGILPTESSIETDGLPVSKEAMRELLSVDEEIWARDIEDQKGFFTGFGTRLPGEISQEHEALKKRLSVLVRK